ncbi:hypothetical protein V6N11_064896 [Hibiscus sabdariffa]|uniref:Uncharacterized protein n=1 Tax=Hibiscus sabdariffa TaxID=183260 RepID=A0ABR2SJ01_9ROSI
MFQDHVVEIQGPDASFGERQLAIKASHCNVSSWKSISDSSPIADKRSESGDSAEDKTLGNSENDKLMGSGNVSLEKNNLDGEKSNRQLVVESSRQEGEELLHGKVNKCSWATVVARSSPEIPLETGGTQLHYGNESDNPLSPNKAAVEPINRDGLHSVSLGGSKNGQEHQEASFSWAQTIDLVNNKSIPDCIEIGKPSNQREAEELGEQDDNEEIVENRKSSAVKSASPMPMSRETVVPDSIQSQAVKIMELERVWEGNTQVDLRVRDTASWMTEEAIGIIERDDEQRCTAMDLSAECEFSRARQVILEDKSVAVSPINRGPQDKAKLADVIEYGGQQRKVRQLSEILMTDSSPVRVETIKLVSK